MDQDILKISDEEKIKIDLNKPDQFQVNIKCSDGVVQTDGLILLTKSQLIKENIRDNFSSQNIDLSYTVVDKKHLTRWLLSLIDDAYIDVKSPKETKILDEFFQIVQQSYVYESVFYHRSINTFTIKKLDDILGDKLFPLLRIFTDVLPITSQYNYFPVLERIKWDQFNLFLKKLVTTTVKIIDKYINFEENPDMFYMYYFCAGVMYVNKRILESDAFVQRYFDCISSDIRELAKEDENFKILIFKIFNEKCEISNKNFIDLKHNYFLHFVDILVKIIITIYGISINNFKSVCYISVYPRYTSQSHPNEWILNDFVQIVTESLSLEKYRLIVKDSKYLFDLDKIEKIPSIWLK